LAVEPIVLLDRLQGALALALERSASEDTLAVARFVLARSTEELALRLQLQAGERELRKSQEEAMELACLADIGELARPVAHEFNNFLNAIMLHIAALPRDLPEKLRDGLAEIRSQGSKVAGMVKQFQQYRRREPPSHQQADLNRAVEEAVRAVRGRMAGAGVPAQRGTASPTAASLDRLAGAEVSLQLSLAPALLPVLVSASDLKRLCTFLLANAAIAAHPGCVWVRTTSSGSKVFLRLEDTGPLIAPELLGKAFHPLVICRDGTSSLELASCLTLVRRLHGKIHCENRSQGGVAFVVELPAPA
jgi:C4-dicarboxylate-specific signal transduction histidine kinase